MMATKEMTVPKKPVPRIAVDMANVIQKINVNVITLMLEQIVPTPIVLMIVVTMVFVCRANVSVYKALQGKTVVILLVLMGVQDMDYVRMDYVIVTLIIKIQIVVHPTVLLIAEAMGIV